MEQTKISTQVYESEEFRALASAVLAYDRLVRLAQAEPVSGDPAELLSALSNVGDASVAVVKRAGKL